MIKKVSAVITAFCLSAICIPSGSFGEAVSSFAAEDLEYNGFTYMLNARGNITIK